MNTRNESPNIVEEFGHLVEELNRSLKRWRTAKEDNNWAERRTEAFKSLEAVMRFIDEVTTAPPKMGFGPLHDIFVALDQAMNGIEHPLTKPAPKKGRPRESSLEKRLKGVAAAVMQIAMDDRMTKNQAAAMVAYGLRKMGRRIEKDDPQPPEAATIVAWRERALQSNDPLAEEYTVALESFHEHRDTPSKALKKLRNWAEGYDLKKS